MPILAKLIGILIAALGIVYLVSPKVMQQFIAFFEKEKRVYIAAVCRFIFGIIVLLAATEARFPGVAVILGLVFLLGGVIIFAVDTEKMKALLKWYQECSPLVLRLLAVFIIIFGVLIVYAV
jgi:hypothetical protein